MLELLYHFNWRNIKNDSKQMENQISNFKERSFARKWFQERVGLDNDQRNSDEQDDQDAEDWVDLGSDTESLLDEDEVNDKQHAGLTETDLKNRNSACVLELQRCGGPFLGTLNFISQ